MKLKLDANGNVVTKEVNGVKMPVYVHDDGKEIEFDAAGAMQKIRDVNAEARDHRLKFEEADGKLKAFEGIEDPAAAKRALETVKSFNGKQALTAEEIEQKVKERVTQAVSSTEEKFKPTVAERDKAIAELRAEKIGGSFSRSKYISDKLGIPSDLVQSKFGNAFDIVNGRVVAKGADGKEIYSRARPGELADFDEALETLVNGYEHKDKILKGSGQSGSGSIQNNANGGVNQDLSGLSPVARLTQHRAAQTATP